MDRHNSRPTRQSIRLWTLYLTNQDPEDYPSKAPKVIFSTKVYHPNVDSDSGFISLSILGDEWSPALKISTILLSVQAYLTGPDITELIMPDIAHEYENDRATYKRKAKEWTDKYAGRPEETEHIQANEPAQALSIGYESPEPEHIAAGQCAELKTELLLPWA